MYGHTLLLKDLCQQFICKNVFDKHSHFSGHLSRQHSLSLYNDATHSIDHKAWFDTMKLSFDYLEHIYGSWLFLSYLDQNWIYSIFQETNISLYHNVIRVNFIRLLSSRHKTTPGPEISLSLLDLVYSTPVLATIKFFAFIDLDPSIYSTQKP